MSREEGRRIQDKKLRALIKTQLYPYSPYYHRLFKENNIDPDSIRGVEDLRKIPITRKEDIAPTKDNPKRFMDIILNPIDMAAKNGMDPGKYVVKAMGMSKVIGRMLKHGGRRGFMERMKWEYSPIHLTFTTGRSALPTMFVYTKYDIERLKRAVSRAYEVVGIKKDYRCVSTFPYAPHLAFLGAWQALEHLGIFTFHTGGGKILGTQRIIDAIEAMKPEIITCIPGYGYHMLRTAKSQGRDFSSVKVVITGAEKVPLGMKKKMTEMLEAMGAKAPIITVLYGFTEARTFWAECSSMGQEGYHIYPDMDLIEIVDPKTGERVEEGERGEIVYTPLDGRGSMVLRYGTGDIAQKGLVWDECPHCRRLMPRLSSDIRRTSQIKEFSLTKVKGTLVDLNAFVAIISNFETIEEWQAEIRKKNDDPYELDEFYIHVAPKEGVDFDDLKKSLMAEIVRETEVTPTDIRYCELDEILGMLGMETELKEKRIVDNRPKN